MLPKIKEKNPDEIDIQWLTKGEMHDKMMVFLNTMRYTAELDKNDPFVGFCSLSFKRDANQLLDEIVPDVQMFYDLLIPYLKYRSNKEMIFQRLSMDFLDELYLEEIIHQMGGVTDTAAFKAVIHSMLKDHRRMRSGGWQLISCPKTETEIVWLQCYECTDIEKHKTCPLYELRIDAAPRKYEFGKYHISELNHLKNSYYERIGKPYSLSWREYMPLLLGKAFGWYVESKYAERCREVDLTYRPENAPEDFTFITGHQDLHLEHADGTASIYELKLYAFIGIMIKEDHAKEEHEFQARGYYTMGLKCKPRMYRRIRAIKVDYYSKGKEGIIHTEFEVPLEVIDIATPALLLHRALKEHNPDLLPDCPAWRCRGYCKHIECKSNPKYVPDAVQELTNRGNIQP